MDTFRTLALLLLLFSLVAHPASAQPDAPPFAVVAYYASWNLYSDTPYLLSDVPGDRLTQLVYAFAAISDDGECALADAWADTQAPYPDAASGAAGGHFGYLPTLRATYPDLSITLAIGGWTGSAGFSDAALTSQSRARFVASCVAMMTRYGFDGLDIDWEFPVIGGASDFGRPEDKANLTLLLAELRAALDAQGEADGRAYTLTLAAPSSLSAWQHFEWASLAPLLDHAFLMAYDMAGGWSDVTAPHAPLYADPAAPSQPPLSADATVRAYIEMGVPADKLILGVPFYGVGWHGVPPADDGLYQPFNALLAGLPFRDIQATLIGQPGVVAGHSETSVFAWIYRESDGTFFSCDDAITLAAKARYARQMGLGGVGIWEISQDDDAHTLLNALWDTGN
jgi:chitinase